ncbi:unnamed protein product [Nippostrongylus brasiliensis]|uniref:Transposase n=1 Tax=Nippostrongylus brasiliensis TaxID=27835 RepID=A0A0N4XJK1_NIPBR|nr:unnamed protein product [Nippostrongylus brasiliensis]
MSGCFGMLAGTVDAVYGGGVPFRPIGAFCRLKENSVGRIATRHLPSHRRLGAVYDLLAKDSIQNGPNFDRLLGFTLHSGKD